MQIKDVAHILSSPPFLLGYGNKTRCQLRQKRIKPKSSIDSTHRKSDCTTSENIQDSEGTTHTYIESEYNPSLQNIFSTVSTSSKRPTSTLILTPMHEITMDLPCSTDEGDDFETETEKPVNVTPASILEIMSSDYSYDDSAEESKQVTNATMPPSSPVYQLSTNPGCLSLSLFGTRINIPRDSVTQITNERVSIRYKGHEFLIQKYEESS